MEGLSQLRSALDRIEEALREIGVLIVALTPLDAAFTPENRDLRQRALSFVLIGILFFVAALLMERRRFRAS
jgi:hypothetical protein